MIRDKSGECQGYKFDISYMTERGGRRVNEDSICVECDNGNVFIAVSDGLGAHGGGDVASQTAVETALNEYATVGKISKRKVYDIFQNIDTAIVENQTDEVKMKTTLSCLSCVGGYMHFAYLGDTRIYIFKKNKLTRITADHSLAYEEVKETGGTLDDIRINPNRHILKAALGVGKIKMPVVFKEKIKADISVLICSDGFWEYVNENEMLECLKKTKSSNEWLCAMLEYHSEKAEKYNDNYSAICLRIIKK